MLAAIVWCVSVIRDRATDVDPELTAAFPALGDGVADENEITVALGHAFVEGLMPLGPTAAARYGFGGRMEFFLGDGGKGKETVSQ